MCKSSDEQFSKWIPRFTSLRARLSVFLLLLLPACGLILCSIFVTRQQAAFGQSRKVAGWRRTVTVLVAVYLILDVAGATAADAASESISVADLSRMSIEDLANIEISSVSKHTERLSDATHLFL